MSDRTGGTGDERSTGRFRRPPDEDWTPEDMPVGRHTPRDPLPEERLPGEPPPGATYHLPGSIGPGRNGLTADDLTPEDTPIHRPDPTTDRPPTEALTPGEGGMPIEPGEPIEPGMPIAPGMPYGGPRGMPVGEGRMPAGGGLPSEPGAGRASRMSGEGGGGYESPMPDDGLGVPSPGDVSARDAHTTDSREPDAWPTGPAGTGAHGSATAAGAGPAAGVSRGDSAVGEAAPAPSGAGAPLLPHEETDHWEQAMRQLAAGFVDEPRGAVEQADHVLEEIAGRFEEAVERRRRTLRRSWEASEDRGPGSDTDTEQLRLALRDYQELAGRLLHL